MAPAGGELTLASVGIAGIAKPLAVQRPERVVTLLARFDVRVDLPAHRKGSDLSRNAEALAEVLDESLHRPVSSLEDACARVARELLQRHAYATHATVEAEAEYLRRRGLSRERESYEEYRLIAGAEARRTAGGSVSVSRSVGAEAVGMTACPCAMESTRELLAKEYPLLNDPAMAGFPVVTHNQRNRTRLVFDLPEGVDVEADELLDALEAAPSSPTYSILKRRDEAELVLNAHRNPKFVEDVLRDLLLGLPKRFPRLPDGIGVLATTRSDESIHKFDVVASHRATLGELRAAAPR